MHHLSVITALKSLIILLSLFIIFHMLIVSGIIPYHIVWGGRLKTYGEMLRMESVSIILNVIMLGIAIIRFKYFTLPPQPAVMKIMFRLMFLLFSLNTVGNLMANSLFEMAIYTPVTLLLAILCLRIATDKKGK